MIHDQSTRMSKEEYKEWRKKLGNQAEVAKLLRLASNTISRRELGYIPITDEAALAIVHLVRCLYVKNSNTP